MKLAVNLCLVNAVPAGEDPESSARSSVDSSYDWGYTDCSWYDHGYDNCYTTSASTTTSTTTTATTTTVQPSITVDEYDCITWEDPECKNADVTTKAATGGTSVPFYEAASDKFVMFIAIVVGLSFLVLAVGSVTVVILAKKCKNRDDTMNQGLVDHNETEMTTIAVNNPNHGPGSPQFIRVQPPESGLNLTPRVPDQNATDPGQHIPIADVANRQRQMSKKNKTEPIFLPVGNGKFIFDFV